MDTTRIFDYPAPADMVRFREGTGQRYLLTVDTEEEFDWTKPLAESGHRMDSVPRLRKFQQFCETPGVVPVYLVDYPVATSEMAIELLSGPIAEGKAEIGVQLHPWVNPPHTEVVNQFNSFAGNLPFELERAKFLKLHDTIARNFGAQPLIYRAGRYGLGPNTAQILREAGIAIDTSVRSNFDYSAGDGPNYSHLPLLPWWVGKGRNLLELPLTTVFVGVLRRYGKGLYPKLSRFPRLRGLIALFGLLERIPLTPEGVTIEEALRAVDIAVDDGLPMLILSFHSPSICPGYTPYVRDEYDLDRLYDWWRMIFQRLAERGVTPTSVKAIMDSVELA